MRAEGLVNASIGNGRPKRVLVAAGGTGGHLFPAEALAAVLNERGIIVDLATDHRAEKFAGTFPAIHVIPSATIRGRDPVSLAKTATVLGYGVAKAWWKLPSIGPSIVIGFGGYPSIPAVVAASLRGIPTLIHEQNAVMGRANRFLASRVTAIATGFAGVFDKDPALAAKATHTGNPIRPMVILAATRAYAPPEPNGPLHLLVFGGSQGARVMSDIVPAALARLDDTLRGRFRVVQQARQEDLESVRDSYAKMKVEADVQPFFSDLPARMASSQLVISRSGASTVAELAAIGRPALLVPLPHALDQDQKANAGFLERAGGAIRLDQTIFTPERVAAELTTLASAPDKLTAMAKAAQSAGVIDAAERLADLVLRVAGVIPQARS
jgi:UDP-N-acetylglucosamine--N-acetylmuramyl-(pentapeptide) pyrophosphoryl-undecaprenol N-acetylglucosamine transferase